MLGSAGSVIDGLKEDNKPNITASSLSIQANRQHQGSPLGDIDRSIRQLSNSSRLGLDAGGSVYLRS